MTVRTLAIACLLASGAMAWGGCGSESSPSDLDAGGQTPEDGGQLIPDAGTPDAGGLACESSCPAGSHCDQATQKCVCDHACSAGQYCDVLQVPAQCREVCNHGVGCLANWEVCEVAGEDSQGRPTGTCVPLKCKDGVQCDYGQGCFVPSTGAPYQNADCTCLPERTGPNGGVLPDTCAVYGKVCDFDKESPAPSACRLPRAFESCLHAIGCDSGLDCIEDDGDWICLAPCATTADCPATDELCVPSDPANGSLANHCYLNVCAAPWKTPADRANYFQPCETGLEGQPGTCVPLSIPYSGAYIDIGVCYQAGTATSLGECAPNADRTSPEGLCPLNQYCEPLQPNEAGTAPVGLCRELCNGAPTPNPVAGCGGARDAGGLCLDVSGINAINPNWQRVARMGFCMRECNPFSDEACPADALGNDQGCSPGPTFDQAGYCRALRPDAAGFGVTCPPASAGSFEHRAECADRLMCSEAASVCVALCNLAECSSATTACGACSGLACAACQPSCPEGSCGGDDGCGGTCGCPNAGEVCNGGSCCAPTCPADGCGGDDGCGGTCGCAPGDSCIAGVCAACAADCSAGCGGSDGCGGICGCPSGQSCSGGTCQPCVPDCRNKTCGADGCGGTCGSCGAGEACRPVAADQVCKPVGANPLSQPLGICGAP
jgi:hypothetical protein